MNSLFFYLSHDVTSGSEIMPCNKMDTDYSNVTYTASNLGLLLQKEQNVKGGEGPSGKQAVGINNGTR